MFPFRSLLLVTGLRIWGTWKKLVPIRNTEARNGYYVTNDVTVGRRSFCLHTFGIFREDKMIHSKCMYFKISLYWPQTPLPSFFEIIFYFKNNFTLQISAYQEGTKINTGVNERPLKNIGTHCNIRHHWFQRVPISFSLAVGLSGSIVWIPLNT